MQLQKAFTAHRPAVSRKHLVQRSAPGCVCSTSGHAAGNQQPQPQLQHTAAARRAVLLGLPTLAVALSTPLRPAAANPFQDLARQALRPDALTPEQAVAALLDARSILRDMQVVVATSEDSQERFQARKMWPAYAKWLREVGPSVPVVSGVINASDKETLLSEQYGGRAGEAPGPVDAVYEAFGRVLTISGRTIKEDAQRSPAIVQQAQDALDGLLAEVPKDLLNSAQELRKKRATVA